MAVTIAMDQGKCWLFRCEKICNVFVHLFLFHQLKVKHKSVLAVKDVAEMERVNHQIAAHEMKKKLTSFKYALGDTRNASASKNIKDVLHMR